jgi:hypothetical protein
MAVSLAKLFVALILLNLTIPALAGINVECPAPVLLPQLDANYHECNHGFRNGSCERFVKVFQQLLPRFDCQRFFDDAPVPALWLADDAAMEDYVHLLSRLNTPAAKALFGSAAFRAVLDGALAEEFGPLSRKTERKQQDTAH